MAATETIPVIDLGPYLAGQPGALERTARELHFALTEIGFYFIVNHGVPQSLIDEWSAKDPVVRFEQALVDGGIAATTDFEAIQSRAKREVDEATDEAERSPMPNPEEAAMGLFAGDGYWEEGR